MGKSRIEWTEATWNPIVGCSIATPGCTNCYAMKMASRIEAMNAGLRDGHGAAPHYAGTTHKVKGRAVWTGKLALAPIDTLLAPLRRKKPTTYFVNSMGDLFHEDAPDHWIDMVFVVMALSPQHTFQVLTKRAERMRHYLSDPYVAERIYMHACDTVIEFNLNAVLIPHPVFEAVAPPGPRIHLDVWPPRNVWLGVSTERQKEADARIPELLRTPAAVRFISAEPLLGPIDLTQLCSTGDGMNHLNALAGVQRRDIGNPAPQFSNINRLDWVIVGGESGQNARPISIQWIRELRDQCGAAKTPFFFKQWGEWHPAGIKPSETPGKFAFGDYAYDRATMVQVDAYPRQFTKFGARSVVERVGKAKAGRTLDGRIHDEMPEATQ